MAKRKGKYIYVKIKGDNYLRVYARDKSEERGLRKAAMIGRRSRQRQRKK